MPNPCYSPQAPIIDNVPRNYYKNRDKYVHKYRNNKTCYCLCIQKFVNVSFLLNVQKWSVSKLGDIKVFLQVLSYWPTLFGQEALL